MGRWGEPRAAAIFVVINRRNMCSNNAAGETSHS